MRSYASETKVPVDRTKTEIERTLVRYGASGFMYGWQEDRVAVAFRMRERHIRLELPMPDPDDKAFRLTPTGRARSKASAEQAHDQAVRSRWRALLLIIKAKLEAIEAGVVTFEDEFLAHTVIADGSTVSQWIQPQIEKSYETGQMPELLPQPRREIGK